MRTLITAAARRWRVVVTLCALVAVAGALVAPLMPLDAIPDTSDPQVIVLSEWPGRSADAIDRQVTRPLAQALRAVDGVSVARGMSETGVSYLYLLFRGDVSRVAARQRVVDQLASAQAVLPAGATARVGPDATPTGWVYEYAITDHEGRHDLAELRTLHDRIVRPALAAVPGVVEVATIGGAVRQLQVEVDPLRLAAAGRTMTDLSGALRARVAPSEGRTLDEGGRSLVIRTATATSAAATAADLEAVIIAAGREGSPVRVGDVATISPGPAPRDGAADLDGAGEVVGGIVVMRSGENAHTVASAVDAAIVALRATLPAGVALVTTYDRAGLIGEAGRTLARLLVEATMVVSLVVLLFLGDLRSALIPVAVLLVAVPSSFLVLQLAGATANIMSLGGIALAIGVLIDATLVMLDNAHRRTAGARATAEGLIAALGQLARPVVLSMLVVIVSFLPVITLEAEEGRLFRPLALTKTAVMMAGTLLAVTLAPALIVRLLRGRTLHAEGAHRLTRAVAAIYTPLLRGALRRPRTVLAVNVLAVLVTVPLFLGLSSEYMPPLYEGSLLVMPTIAPGVSVAEGAAIVRAQDGLLAAIPEVARVFGSVGRSSSATDNSPANMVNTIVTLKPRGEWPRGRTLDAVMDDMDAAMALPGVTAGLTQPVRGRLDMARSGVQATLGIKVTGPDTAVVEELASRIEGRSTGSPAPAAWLPNGCVRDARSTSVPDSTWPPATACRRTTCTRCSKGPSAGRPSRRSRTARPPRT